MLPKQIILVTSCGDLNVFACFTAQFKSFMTGRHFPPDAFCLFNFVFPITTQTDFQPFHYSLKIGFHRLSYPSQLLSCLLSCCQTVSGNRALIELNICIALLCRQRQAVH